MLRTTCEISVYEIDGKDVKSIGGPMVQVRSRDTHRILVEIEFEGKRVAVNRRELEAALNAIGVVGT